MKIIPFHYLGTCYISKSHEHFVFICGVKKIKERKYETEQKNAKNYSEANYRRTIHKLYRDRLPWFVDRTHWIMTSGFWLTLISRSFTELPNPRHISYQSQWKLVQMYRHNSEKELNWLLTLRMIFTSRLHYELPYMHIYLCKFTENGLNGVGTNAKKKCDLWPQGDIDPKVMYSQCLFLCWFLCLFLKPIGIGMPQGY